MLLSPSSLAVLAGLALFLAAGYQVIQCALLLPHLTSSSSSAAAASHTCVTSHQGRCCADRDGLKLTQEEYAGVPLALRLEVLAAAVLCMWGAPARACSGRAAARSVRAPARLAGEAASCWDRVLRRGQPGSAQGGAAEAGPAACRESAPGRGAAAHQCAGQPGVRAPAPFWAPALCAAKARCCLAE